MNWAIFLTVLAATESDFRPWVVGDLGLKDKAYTAYQIRQPYLDDVNRVAGTSYTMKQIRASERLPRWCVITYVRHYGARYVRLTGKPLTLEAAARLHNGGPNGWKKRCTDKHWNRFQRKRKELGL